MHTFEHLTNEQRGEIIMWILRYTNDLNPKPLNGLLQAVVEPIKQQLKRDLKKFEGSKDKKSEAGKLGNLKKWHPDLYKDVTNKKRTLEDSLIIAKNRTATNLVAQVAVTDTVTVTVKDKVIDSKEIGEVKPSHLPSFLNWLEYRKEIKRPIKAKSTLKALVKVFNKNSVTCCEWVVNHSIENNYQGLFWDKYTESKTVKSKRIPL